MNQRILVAVDGSNISDLALKEAIKLAQDRRARLRIVHVVNEVTLNLYVDSRSLNKFFESCRTSGQRILAKARAVASGFGVEAETNLLEIQTIGRRVADMIVDHAKSIPTDLIVMGTNRRRGLQLTLRGSVARDVARLSPIPVSLIHEH